MFPYLKIQVTLKPTNIWCTQKVSFWACTIESDLKMYQYLLVLPKIYPGSMPIKLVFLKYTRSFEVNHPILIQLLLWCLSNLRISDLGLENVHSTVDYFVSSLRMKICQFNGNFCCHLIFSTLTLCSIV